MKTILVIAAHPDDEVLGCGATIARYARAGHGVHALICSSGIASRYSRSRAEGCAVEQVALRESSAKANAILGVSSHTVLDFPDNRMDSVDLLDLVKAIEEKIELFKPDTVLTHHAGDLNIDHRRIHDAVATACRPLPGCQVRNLLFFEVPSSTEWTVAAAPAFRPTVFIDVSSTIETKLRALEEYRSEMRSWPHPRSMQAVEHLARWRGATAGFEAAEAFELGRSLLD